MLFKSASDAKKDLNPAEMTNFRERCFWDCFKESGTVWGDEEGWLGPTGSGVTGVLFQGLSLRVTGCADGSEAAGQQREFQSHIDGVRMERPAGCLLADDPGPAPGSGVSGCSDGWSRALWWKQRVQTEARSPAPTVLSKCWGGKKKHFQPRDTPK